MYGGLLHVMQNISVKNIIIGKQFESCENYEEFIKIAKNKKIKINIVEAGNKINIEKNIYFDVLWPCSESVINNNKLNNNSLVCKLVYKDFSVLFTGDIEEVAEKSLLNTYSNNMGKLSSTVLKVPHHGSKSSSTQDFLSAVSPNYVLIGVGKNNKFGHPNEEVLKRITGIRCKNI